MPPPASQESPSKSSLLLALVCASIVADYDRSWLARPVAQLIPEGGPRADRLSRLKAKLRDVFADLVEAATRRGRRPVSPQEHRAPVLGALLAVATRLLAQSHIPVRRRAVQDELVCAFDRLHAEHRVTAHEFCEALSLPERTLRSWQYRPPKPPPPPPPPSPPAPPPNDRSTGRFDLGVTAPDTQLGGDTTDLRVLGVDLKLVGVQDVGDRERCLFDAFAVDERESADLIKRVVADAAATLAGIQFITDQGTPYLAEAAKQAYDAIGVEHAPQREGTRTEKATVERGFGTIKNALAPILALLDRVATAVPQLKQPVLARHVATLLVATFLRVYAAGRRHFGHPLDGQDPDVLRTIVEEQRDKARAEDRSVRLFLEAVHAEYAMPGSREAFVRAFRRYPLDDLKDAERRFRAHACRCQVRVCDRYFAAVVRDVHDRNARCRSADRVRRRAAGDTRRARGDAERRAAQLDAHPELRLHEALDVLAETWQPDTGQFLLDGQLARAWLRVAVVVFAGRERDRIGRRRACFAEPGHGEFARRTGLPTHLHASHPRGHIDRRQRDIRDHHAQEVLALGGGRGRRMPYRRQILDSARMRAGSASPSSSFSRRRTSSRSRSSASSATSASSHSRSSVRAITRLSGSTALYRRSASRASYRARSSRSCQLAIDLVHLPLGLAQERETELDLGGAHGVE